MTVSTGAPFAEEYFAERIWLLRKYRGAGLLCKSWDDTLVTLKSVVSAEVSTAINTDTTVADNCSTQWASNGSDKHLSKAEKDVRAKQNKRGIRANEKEMEKLGVTVAE